MGLFSKKKEDEQNLDIPKLPELPGKSTLPPARLPETKDNSEIDDFETSLHQLPSFPSNGFGNKFSQNTIKNAVLGDSEKDEDEPTIMPPEFKISPPEKIEPPKEKKLPKIEPPKTDKIELQRKTFEEPKHKSVEAEPIFIRIDKFEESLKIFNRIKTKVSEIESLLNETKELKNKEDEQLSSWQEEIQKLKFQIEKVDEDIFSKIE